VLFDVLSSIRLKGVSKGKQNMNSIGVEESEKEKLIIGIYK